MKKFEHQWPDFRWVDCENPTQGDLLNLADEFAVPANIVSTCLDPKHLPTCTFLNKTVFIILRHQDPAAKHKAATMQELTTKLILFFGKDFVLTIHRAPLPVITEQKEKATFHPSTQVSFLKHIFMQTLESFEQPLDELNAKTDQIEERVFALKRQNILRSGYMVKRKTSSYRKVFKFTADILYKLPTEIEVSLRDLSHVREPLEKHIFYADSIHEEVSGLLNLHLSIMSQKTNEASYRTNEVMRVLTVFSIFFLPLNFIAGVYGMNFENMPELKYTYGYYSTLALMLLIVMSITYWIYRKGWLKKDELL